MKFDNTYVSFPNFVAFVFCGHEPIIQALILDSILV